MILNGGNSNKKKTGKKVSVQPATGGSHEVALGYRDSSEEQVAHSNQRTKELSNLFNKLQTSKLGNLIQSHNDRNQNMIKYASAQ